MATITPNNKGVFINPNDELTLYSEQTIDSRIERFLYAVCSMDISDLPIPLSRIEQLYKCLAVGGSLPDFEPQSRAEKFLMAILGSYDLNSLPEPKSRSEILLSKIATGDYNLQDVEWIQSRYEFLLAYIIKTGGIGDFEITSVLLMIEGGDVIVDENGEDIELEKIRTKK